MRLKMRSILPSVSRSSASDALALYPQQLDKLEPGCSVVFGESPLRCFHHQKFQVAQFETMKFERREMLSYTLRNPNGDTYFLKPQRQGEEYHVALSRELSAEEASFYFGADTLGVFLSPSSSFTLKTVADMRRRGDWIAENYVKVIDCEAGSLLPGRAFAFVAQENAEPMTYTLLMSDDGHAAIEMTSVNGRHRRTLATLYRPLSEISQVQFPLPAPANLPPLSVQEKEAIDEPRIETPSVEETKAPTNDFRRMPTGKDESDAAAKLGQHYDQLVSCDLRTAARVIETSLREKMTLADTVRRVLDLPLAIQDEVHFDLNLTDEDYRHLAQRYKLPLSERALIRHQLAKELSQKMKP